MSKQTIFQKINLLNPFRLGKGQFDTLIGSGSLIEGNLFLKQNVRVDGTVKGGLQESDGASISVMVGTTGLVTGNIIAGRVVVAGQVHGNICAMERVELQAGCTVIGDIKYQSMAVEHGANLHGLLLQMESGDTGAKDWTIQKKTAPKTDPKAAPTNAKP